MASGKARPRPTPYKREPVESSPDTQPTELPYTGPPTVAHVARRPTPKRVPQVVTEAPETSPETPASAPVPDDPAPVLPYPDPPNDPPEPVLETPIFDALVAQFGDPRVVGEDARAITSAPFDFWGTRGTAPRQDVGNNRELIKNG